MPIPLLVLNYNGRALLEECLPSLMAAIAASRYDCRLVVIDNDSRDDSRDYLRRAWPEAQVIHAPNHGLCSYNDVLRETDAPVAVLLNNDIKLQPDALDPLLTPLLAKRDRGDETSSRVWMTAPRCMGFDQTTYDGQKTALGWRWGLVQGTWRFPGHERLTTEPDWTASAGAVLAVDCQVFRTLGGFDPLYLPGRLEDLDLAFRAWQAGCHALYVPESVALHRGMATFGAAFGRAACDQLTLRNTLLFQWKNLRHPRHRWRQVLGWLARSVWDVARAPWQPASRRWSFCRAWREARRRASLISAGPQPQRDNVREQAWFARFSPPRLRAVAERDVQAGRRAVGTSATGHFGRAQEVAA